MKNLTLHLNRYTFLKKMSVLTTATILAGCSMAPIYERPVFLCRNTIQQERLIQGCK